jgi:transcriptional regulator with XRE-family HTH domain
VLARRAGITPKFVSQIESAKVNPSIEVVAKLVEDGLSLPMSAFFAPYDGDIRGDLEQLQALIGKQPASVRRVALRMLTVLCDELAR